MAEDHKVTRVTQETQLADTGQGFRPVFKVHYQVTGGPAEGTTGHIIVPATDYEPEKVASALANVVKKHQNVHGI